jgi:HSP20 family molecular chaperone IbpA
MLTIKGKKKKAEEVKEENYYRSERSYGSFVRISGSPKVFHVEKKVEARRSSAGDSGRLMLG